MDNETYSDKLRTSEWQRKRLEILERDNFTCTFCKVPNLEVHVHHFYYIGGLKPYEYPNDMLTTLCYICHEREKKRSKVEAYLLNSLRMKGYLAFDLLNLSTRIDTDNDFNELIKSLLRRGIKIA